MQRLLLCFFFSVISVARAVTVGAGPGGVGTTDGTSQLELWLKADGLSLTNGAKVTSWADASGHSTRTLKQATASLEPTYITNVLNGKPVVRFNNSDFSSLTLPSTNNQFTVVAVLRPTVKGIYQNIVEGSGGNRPMLWMDVNTDYEFNLDTGAVTPATGGDDIVACVVSTIGTSNSQLYLNGPTLTATGPNAFAIPSSQTYTFFNRTTNGTDAQRFYGDVAELIVYSTALTAAEIDEVGYYLQQKYAVNGTFTPPYPVLTGYSQSPAVYGVSTPITPDTPVVGGTGTVTSYSVAPALPAGLTLNPTTGVISGTPTAVSAPAVYTVTELSTGNPSSTFPLSITVQTPQLTGYSANPAIFTRTRAATPIQPVLSGSPVTNFTVSPALPAGLTLDPGTGIISGTPSVIAASATYTVTASPTGVAPSSCNLTLQVLDFSTTLDISEFMASNSTTIVDGDGLYSDWVEIHNTGTIPIDFGGWALTDKATKLQKWVAPSKIIPAGGYLLVFCSGDSHIDSLGYLHANFNISASGEYLALVQPNGTTIARQFSPSFPAQTTDVSYGTPDGVTYGFYTTPTPGTANGYFNAVQSTVSISPPGGTFSGTLNVTMTAPLAPGAVIRYTLDGTAVTAASPVYSAPFGLTTNTEIRAKIFQPNLDPSLESSQVYMALGADLQGFSSNLPLVFINADGAIPSSTSDDIIGASSIILPVNGATGRTTTLGETPNYVGRGGIHIRGRSSASFPQKQYKFETWSPAGNNQAAPLLGMNSNSDWVLYAPWSDKAMVRNALAYSTWAKLGWPSLNFVFVEAFVNQTGAGQFTYADHYAGVYMLVESIGLDRLNLDGPEPTGTTGGFVTEYGCADDEDFSTTGTGRAVGEADNDPNADDLNPSQQAWVINDITTFEQALYGPGFKNPATGLPYTAYTDVASQVDYKIAREWSRNFDGGSTYTNIPRGGKLEMGPLWDYNWAFGNVNYSEGGDTPAYLTNGWNLSFTSNTNGWAPYWLQMDLDPDFWQQVTDRWAVLRQGVLADAAVTASITTMTNLLGSEAAARNFARWPQLGLNTGVSAPGYDTRTTYQSEVDYLTNWLQQRSAWIDSQFATAPVFSPAAGVVSSGTVVTITGANPGGTSAVSGTTSGAVQASATSAVTNGASGQAVTAASKNTSRVQSNATITSDATGATIYYTTDGTDPRLSGGGISASAHSLASGAGVTLTASATLMARVDTGTAWGPPTTGVYVVGTAASATNLIITEINYYPSAPTSAELANTPTLTDADFEFIELHNIGASTLQLGGVGFTQGIAYTFPNGATLAPGGYVILVENPGAFALRYGGNIPIGGQYTGKLDNSGETLVLAAADGSTIAQVTYSSAWSTGANGQGYTLTLRDPTTVPANYSDPSAWALSATVNGSPGADNGPVFTPDFTLWAQSSFTAADLANPARSGLLADPDGDGASNLLEFAMGTLPLDATSRPVLNMTTANSQTTISFTRARQALGVTYVVQQSGDLVNWTPVTTPLSVVSQTSSTEVVQTVVPQVSGQTQFFRLTVSRSN